VRAFAACGCRGPQFPRQVHQDRSRPDGSLIVACARAGAAVPLHRQGSARVQVCSVPRDSGRTVHLLSDHRMSRCALASAAQTSAAHGERRLSSAIGAVRYPSRPMLPACSRLQRIKRRSGRTTPVPGPGRQASVSRSSAARLPSRTSGRARMRRPTCLRRR